MAKTVSKREDQNGQRQTETCNMVFLAGVIYDLRLYDNSAWILLETGNRKIPFKCFKNETTGELLDKLANYQKGDFMKIVGEVRQIQNRTTKDWDLTVILTTIKSPIPEKRAVKHERPNTNNDDLPF